MKAEDENSFSRNFKLLKGQNLFFPNILNFCKKARSPQDNTNHYPNQLQTSTKKNVLPSPKLRAETQQQQHTFSSALIIPKRDQITKQNLNPLERQKILLKARKYDIRTKAAIQQKSSIQLNVRKNENVYTLKKIMKIQNLKQIQQLKPWVSLILPNQLPDQ